MLIYRWLPYAFFLLSIFCSVVTADATQPTALIAIDVGHSKMAPGATSAYGVPEFEFNAALAENVAAELTTGHGSVLMIGADGRLADLFQRTEQATVAGANFLLSIHHDAVQAGYLNTWNWKGAEQRYADQFSGFSLFVSRRNPYPAQSLQCAAAIGSALLKKGFHYSEHHAAAERGEKKAWADKTHGVYYYDDLVVLRTASQPAVLLEAGIIVNRKEAVELQKSAVQQRMAQAVHAGLQQCGIIK